jgi:hypothetical protein
MQTRPVHGERQPDCHEAEELPSLPHTCNTCGAHFKQGETDALGEHLEICGSWNIEVCPEGTTRPWAFGGPLHGERQPGDTADIWALWVKGGRRGARSLVERHCARTALPEKQPPSFLSAPTPERLARHVQFYGEEGAGRWLGDASRPVNSASWRTPRGRSQTRMVKRPKRQHLSVTARTESPRTGVAKSATR